MRIRKAPSGPVVTLLTEPNQLANGNSGTAKTIDWSQGANQSIVLTGNAVISRAGLPSGETASLTLQVTQDATGGRTIAFVDGVSPGGTVAIGAAANATSLLDLLWTGHNLIVTVRGATLS